MGLALKESPDLVMQIEHREGHGLGTVPALGEEPPHVVPLPRGDGSEELVLRLHTREVALLLDIFEAALPSEKISGLQTRNPDLTHFFNSVYGGLITTARQHGWGST